jgi:hypothetical protein
MLAGRTTWECWSALFSVSGVIASMMASAVELAVACRR